MMRVGQLARGWIQRAANRPILSSLGGECGQNLVEYAVMVIVFMSVLFGIAGFGHALYAYHFVSTEAREATRWAAVNGSACNSDNSCNGVGGMNNGPALQSDIQNYVTNHTPPGIDPNQITTTAVCGVQGGAVCPASPSTCSTQVNAPGCTVEVQVSYNFNFIFPLIRTGPLTLSSTSEMVIAH